MSFASSPHYFAWVALTACLLAGCEQAAVPAAQNRTQGEAPSARVVTPPPDLDSAQGADATVDADPPPVADVAKTSAPAVTKDVTFDELKFEMEKTEPFLRSMLTPPIEALVDQPIRIRGYIRPTPYQDGITQFVLVRDNLECCFGPGAWLYDCVLVEMNPGKSTSYTIRPVAVEGTFSVREFLGPDGKHLAIYHLQADKVE